MKKRTINIGNLRHWLKSSGHPMARFLFRSIKRLRAFELTYPKVFSQVLYHFHNIIINSISAFFRIVWWTPLLKGRLRQYGKSTYLYGGLPYISGPLVIDIGNHCRISGQTTFSGRTASQTAPELIIGDNVDVGWMTTIAVGQKVVLGNNVRIAGRAFLAGYPGHPIDAEDRAQGLPDTDDQVGNIVLEDDVWLATGVSVMADVTIGRGSIIAAGSVVTKDIPAGVLAAGVPAKVIKKKLL